MISVTLELNTMCNMNCKYCYLGEKTNNVMSLETAIQGINFATNKLFCDRHKKKEIEIDFLGGEPLLSFDLIKQIVNYTNSIKSDIVFSYSITTNGTIFDEEVLEFLINNNVSLRISLDGKKKSNDAERIMKNGESSFDIVMANLKFLSEYEIKTKKLIQISSVITKNNYLNYADNVIYLVNNIGFRYIDAGIDSSYQWEERELVNLKKQYQIIFDYYYDMNNNGNPFIWKYIEEVSDKGVYKLYSCGAGICTFYINYEGKIYPCPSAMDINFELGNTEKGLFGSCYNELMMFNNMKSIVNLRCNSCFYETTCTAKGCLVSNLIENNDYNKPSSFNCRFFKLSKKFADENIERVQKVMRL